MSIKEQIRKIAADPQKGRLLSAQMLMAAREGFNPTMILEDGSKVRLIRVGTRQAPGQR